MEDQTRHQSTWTTTGADELAYTGVDNREKTYSTDVENCIDRVLYTYDS